MKRRVWLLAGLSGIVLLLVWLAALSITASAASPMQAEEPVQHVVEAGETLGLIAERYNTTVEAIVEANGLTDPNLIAVGQKLIIPSTAGEGSLVGGSAPAENGSELATYIVVPGDTLEAVARRFDTTLKAVARLNGIVNPISLFGGGRLQVPGQFVGRLHRVAVGETALGLAFRYGVPLWELLAANSLSSAGALLPGQRIWVPGGNVTDTGTPTLPKPFLALDIGPAPVLQGQTARIKADLVPGAEVQGVIAEEVLRFAVEGESHYALFGIHALADSGVYPIALLATDPTGDEIYLTRSIEVVDAGYQTEEINLSVDLLDTEALTAERVRIAEIQPIFTPERFWDGLFSRPITTEITSFFGTRRLYKYPSTQFYGYHEGTDFKGAVGSPVYAPAAGIVVLAEPLYLRGNALVIDHGWGVYTGYWHLSEFSVAVGQKVEAGDLIARVGNTGRSTGAHLHWDFWVNGTNVDALQWTEQPFP